MQIINDDIGMSNFISFIDYDPDLDDQKWDRTISQREIIKNNMIIS